MAEKEGQTDVAKALHAYEGAEMAELVAAMRESLKEELKQEMVAQPSSGALPPGAKRDPATGEVYREVTVSHPGAEPAMRRRPVCLTSLEDAQRLEQDFYHPKRGWLRRGVKGERDPEPLVPQF